MSKDNSDSILPGDRKGRCYICSRIGPTQLHHVVPGSYKHACDRYGLTAFLCPECHGRLHSEGLYYRELKQFAQIQFLLRYSETLWLKEFYKNYLVGDIGPFPFKGNTPKI